MAGILSEKELDHDSDSDASFLCLSISDMEELKLQEEEELKFVDGYFLQEKPLSSIPKPSYHNAAFSIQDSSDDITEASDMLLWDRFSSWIDCFAVVTFDLEIGQMIEEIYPSHVNLSEIDKTSLCYLAFPDSNSGCMGDTQFHFRIKQMSSESPSGSSQDPNLISPSVIKAHARYNQLCPPAFRIEPSYLWGFAYFRQVKDKNLRRGYFQKSLVIVSRLPFFDLFQQVSMLLAPEFFEKGSICLEAAAKEIDKWPIPVPGMMLHLPLMGTVFQVQIPCLTSPGSPTSATTVTENKSPQHSASFVRHRCLVATNVEMFSALSSLLPHLYLLWELMLCGEPLVVMANNPSICSNVVQALVYIINPLQYCHDYRPFFTIHDSEFKEYTARGRDPPSVLLGVTNPFFAKALQNWPHIIRMGDTLSNGAMALKVRIKKMTSQKTDFKPGVYTSYKSYLQRDKVLMKMIAKGVQTRRPNEVQSALIRRHFLELTHSFMIPLERYIVKLMPLQKTISPYKAVPLLSPFKSEDFLASVEQCGPQLTSGVKGDWIGLYQRFIRTPNFESWFKLRHQEAMKKLHILQMEALSQSDISHWLRGKREVEVVDMVLRLREKLDVASDDNAIPVSPQLRQHLQGQLKTVIDSLPEDLRSVFEKI